MQLFLRAQNTHTLEVTGQETVGQIKVEINKCKLHCWIARLYFVILGSNSLFCHMSGSRPDSGGSPRGGSGGAARRLPPGR